MLVHDVNNVIKFFTTKAVPGHVSQLSGNVTSLGS